jgi:hypothetical protein
MRGTARDPKLGRRTVRLRLFVLETLLQLATNEQGTGANLTADELLRVYRRTTGELDDVSARELGQAARHFALEAGGERCLYWVNADGYSKSSFGVSREGREAAERLAAAYGGRISREEIIDKADRATAPLRGQVPLTPNEAHDLAERFSASDRLTEAPAPAPDVAYLERQATPGLDRQNAGRGGRNDRDDADATLAQFSEGNGSNRRRARMNSSRATAIADLLDAIREARRVGVTIESMCGLGRRLDAVWRAADRLEEALVDDPMEATAGDRMAAAIDLAVRAGDLDARSPAGDARLDWGDPWSEAEARRVLEAPASWRDLERADAELLVDSGLLFEVNRRVLHPLGLALAVECVEDVPRRISPRLRRTDDPEGIYFGAEAFEDGARKFEEFWIRERDAWIRRREILGFVVQAEAVEGEDER